MTEPDKEIAGKPDRSAAGLFYGIGLPGLILCNFSTALIAALGTGIERELRISHTLLGAIQAAFFVGSALGSVLFTSFVRKRGIKGAGLVSVALLVFGNLLSAVPLFSPIVAGRAALGLAVSGMVLFASSVAVHAFPGRQSALLNLIHALLAGASMLGMLTIVPLADLMGGWIRVPLVLAAITGGLFVATALTRVSWTDGSGDGNGRAEERIRWCDGGLLRWAFLLFAYILVETAVIVFYPVYAQERLGASPAAAARLGALFIGGIVVGRLLAAWFVKDDTGRPLTLVLIVAGGALILLSLTAICRPAAGALLFFGGLLAGPTAPLAVSLAVRHVGHSRNAVLSFMNLLSCVGGFGGALLAGWLSDSLGLQKALLLSSLVFLTSAVPLLKKRSGT